MPPAILAPLLILHRLQGAFKGWTGASPRWISCCMCRFCPSLIPRSAFDDQDFIIFPEMLIMTPPASRKHILVISPGTDLPAILASALSDPGAVTHTVILAEGLLVTDRTGETTQERAAKVALRNGITRAHDLALSLGIPAKHRTLDPTTVDSVCSQVMDIAARHPGARFSFVLSGGTAPLALGLFRMAAWLDGDVYFASRKAVLKKLTVPKIPASALAANPNYEAILTLLHKKPAVPGVISGVPPGRAVPGDGGYVCPGPDTGRPGGPSADDPGQLWPVPCHARTLGPDCRKRDAGSGSDSVVHDHARWRVRVCALFFTCSLT